MVPNSKALCFPFGQVMTFFRMSMRKALFGKKPAVGLRPGLAHDCPPGIGHRSDVGAGDVAAIEEEFADVVRWDREIVTKKWDGFALQVGWRA